MYSGASDIVELTFDNNFGIEASNDGHCAYDYLQIRNGATESSPAFFFSSGSKLCGYTAPPNPIQSTGQYMLLLFHTDNSVQDIGFKISYKSVTPSARARRDLLTRNLTIPPADGVAFNLALYPEQDDKKELRRERRSSGSGYSSSYPYGGSSSYTWGSGSGTGGYYGSTTYDSNFWDNYNSWYDSFDPYANFDNDGLSEYNWPKAYELSEALDYSDLRPFALFSNEEVRFFGTQANDFIAQCTFDGRVCNGESFHQFQNPEFGNCYVFNSIFNSSFESGLYSTLRNTSKTGKKFGLKLTLFLDKDEYIGVLSQSSGVHVRVILMTVQNCSSSRLQH